MLTEIQSKDDADAIYFTFKAVIDESYNLMNKKLLEKNKEYLAFGHRVIMHCNAAYLNTLYSQDIEAQIILRTAFEIFIKFHYLIINKNYFNILKAESDIQTFIFLRNFKKAMTEAKQHNRSTFEEVPYEKLCSDLKEYEEKILNNKFIQQNPKKLKDWQLLSAGKKNIKTLKVMISEILNKTPLKTFIEIDLNEQHIYFYQHGSSKVHGDYKTLLGELKDTENKSSLSLIRGLFLSTIEGFRLLDFYTEDDVKKITVMLYETLQKSSTPEYLASLNQKSSTSN